MSPLLSEDAMADPGETPARALTRREVTNAQKQDAAALTPPKPPAAPPNSGGAGGRPPDSASGISAAEQEQQAPPAQEPAPKAARSNPKAPGVPGAATPMTPEQVQYAQKVAANPWLPIFDTGQMGGEALWNIAHHVGAAWNSLIDPNAMSASQHQIWSRNDAVGKLMQFFESGGLSTSSHDQAEWFFENIFPAIDALPAYLNPISGTALLGLGLAGEGPAKAQDIPSAVTNALPVAEIGTVAQNPEAIKDPELAARLFWKSASATLLGLSVLPFGRVLRGLKILKPEQIQELQQTAERLKALQPGDPGVQPDGALLQRALNLPPLPDESLVARGATRDLRTMERSASGEYSDLTAKQRGRINKALGINGFEDLPHAAPNWNAAQVKLARKVLPGWLPYDLVRKSSQDVVPEDPRLFLDQLGEQEGPAALRYLSAFDHAHLQVLRGPTLDPLNAAESMVHSLPAVHTGTRYVMTKFFGAEEELMKAAGLNDRELMKAIRDPDAYAALSPAGKVVVNAQKILRRVYADQARGFGHREGFVPNYDPRVRLDDEEQPVQGTARGLRGGAKSLTSESKAAREETFAVNPDDPAQIALTEKYPDVFALNKAMGELRTSFIANETKSNRQRILEDRAAHGRDDPIGAMRARTTLDEMEGRWEPPDPKLVAQATERAVRRYPMFHEGLHAASLRSLDRQIMALHSHIGLQQALSALAHDGNPLAFERTAREIPAGYKKLDNASPVFDNYLFHPDLANPLNRISQKQEASALDTWVKLNQLSVGALMFSPMIHCDNMLGRAAWLLSKHPLAGASEGSASIAHSKPWAMLEQLLGVKHASEAERIKWQMGMELQAINAGVIPHFPSQGLANLLFSEYGKVIGDVSAFERPGTRETWRLPPAFQGIEGAARTVGRGYDSLQNLLWGRIVMPLGIFAFHVERAAFKAAHPELPDLVADQYAAHLANRWQGAIEPMARSQAMNTLWKSMGFAINWVRSFYELALPSYLSKSAVAAHPELKGYILRQEMQSLIGMMAAQHISGNLMNMMLSGHPQWENDPHNRYYLEVTRPEVIRGLQALGLYKNVDAASGRDPQTGGKLVVENPVARQQLQLERMLGLEPGTSPMQGGQDMIAGHLAPLVDTLAAAFNLNLPQSILSGTPRWIDQGNPKPEPPWQSSLPSVLAQFLGVSSTVGHQIQLDQAGRPVDQSTMPTWLQQSPVPDAVKRYAAPAAQQVWNWMTGIRAPYVRVEKTDGNPIPDQNYAQYAQLSESYKTDMTAWSDQLMQGKITPYEWRTKYAARAHDYATRLDQIFNGAPEYKQGALGLYAGYQKLYNDAQLPDGTGVDWGKLDGLRADFTAHLTAAQQADLQTEIAKHDNAYPALGMYRATIDAHTQMAKDFAQSQGVSYGNLMAELQAAQALDPAAFRQYQGQHPDLARYFQAQTQWEINTWPGRLYSLYYHTAALSKWLIPTEGAAGPAAEEKALSEIEQHYHAPAAAAG